MSAKKTYERLTSTRDPYLSRARACAALTIPALVPPDLTNGTTSLPQPFQSLGSRGLNNLAAKLMLTLFPTHLPHARLEIDLSKLPELEGEDVALTEIEVALRKIEDTLRKDLNATGDRTKLLETIKQLLVAGNVLLYLPASGGVRVFRLDRFVLKRDPMGGLLELVVMEDLHPVSLTDAVRIACKVQEKADGDKTVKMYTHVKRKSDGSWSVVQEINDIMVPGTSGTYNKDSLPWVPLRFTAMDNEDYGRAFVDEYYGDLSSLETLSQAIVEGSAAAAKVIFLVNPNGSTKKDTIAQAPNGAVREGVATDVTTLQMQKFNDFRVAKDSIADISERLSYAFMLHSAIQRDAERVTREEIRVMANDLEVSLGGVYSLLAQELQVPYVRRQMKKLTAQNKLPHLPKDSITPTVVTGLESLGRATELSNLDEFMQRAGSANALESDVDVGEYLRRVGTYLNVDTEKLLYTEEQKVESQRRQMMMQMGQGAIPNATKGIMDAVNANNQ